MTKLEEAVKAVIVESEQWGIGQPLAKPFATALVRAAITALKGPSEQMIDASCGQFSGNRLIGKAIFDTMLTACLDEAKAEGE